jgi:hypothetical protein
MASLIRVATLQLGACLRRTWSAGNSDIIDITWVLSLLGFRIIILFERDSARNIVWDRRGLECCKKKSWKGGKNCRYLKLARSLIIYLLWRKLRKTDVTIYLILLPCPMKLHQGGPIRGGMWPLVTRNLVLVVYNWLAGRKSATRLLSWPQQRFFTVRSLRTESAPLAPGSSGARLMY